MAILIKGISAPKTCNECFAAEWCDDCGVECPFCGDVNKYTCEDTKPETCPMISVEEENYV